VFWSREVMRVWMGTNRDRPLYCLSGATIKVHRPTPLLSWYLPYGIMFQIPLFPMDEMVYGGRILQSWIIFPSGYFFRVYSALSYWFFWIFHD
jgi:hypothetical protein